MEQGELSKKHWRKSAQWASLTRKHAQIVSDDVAVADVFAKHCRVDTDKKTGHIYKCIADEVSSRPQRCASVSMVALRELLGTVACKSHSNAHAEAGSQSFSACYRNKQPGIHGPAVSLHP